MGRKTKYKLEQVAIRMVREAPFYSDTPIIRVEDAVKVAAEALRDYDREVFGVINIRSDGRPININIASIGTINASLASPKEILKSTILSNAADILLFHNHPGGRRIPSKQDIEMTDKMLLACKLMDVNVLDHIILFGGNVKEYYSFRENEILVFPENRYKTNVSELDFEQKNFGECSLFETINWKVYDESTGVPSLSASTIEKIRVAIPCLKEQIKIADCLSAYDDAIQIEKDKLEVWKEIKKGLLQQMFV